MRAALRRLHSPDVQDLTTFRPEDPTDFALLLQAMIGPEGEPGEESFDVLVCTPNWLVRHHTSDDVVIGRHHLIVFNYDFARLAAAIEQFCVACEGTSWSEVVSKLTCLGRWEFENYTSR